MAYGGYNDDNTITISFEKVHKKQYLLISKDITKQFYFAYVRNVDGNYMFKFKVGKNMKKVKILRLNDKCSFLNENCYSYIFIETKKSSRLAIKPDGSNIQRIWFQGIFNINEKKTTINK